MAMWTVIQCCIVHIGMSRAAINSTAASLLGFLHSGPMTGWELDRAVAETIANFWNVTRSQVYRELRTLATLGYVEAGETGPRERRPYSITPSGREAFSRWIARNPGPALVRIPVLLTVFFADHLPAQRLREIVEDQRRVALAHLEHFRSLLATCGDDAPYQAAVVRFGIGYEQSLLDWLDALPAGGQTAAARTAGPEGATA
jgi:DNA-binding PadR family transcriptional regulator